MIMTYKFVLFYAFTGGSLMRFKRLCAAALAAGLCFSVLPPLSPVSAAEPFDDVPASSYAYQDLSLIHI